MPKTISSFELTLNSRPHHQTLTNWFYGELRSPFLKADLRRAPGCRRPEISPASMGSRGERSSAFSSVCKPRGMYPAVLDSVRGSIV